MWSSALLLLCACASATPPPSAPTAGVASGPIDVRLQARAGTAGDRAVTPGGVLRSGEPISLDVAVSRPAYLSVVQFFPDGTNAVLYPPPGAPPLRASPGQATRIPPGEPFVLDANVGEENVYVVASAEPLAQAGLTVEGIVQEVRASGGTGTAIQEPEPPPAPEPEVAVTETERRPRVTHRAGLAAAPNMTGEGTRGFQRVASADPAVEIWQDESGVTVFRFAFRHE